MERKGYCCNLGKLDLTYDPTNPKPGSVPPQPPDVFKNLFLNQNFVEQAEQYNNVLAMAVILGYKVRFIITLLFPFQSRVVPYSLSRCTVKFQ